MPDTKMKTTLLAAAIIAVSLPALARPAAPPTIIHQIAERHIIDSIDDNGIVTLDNGDQYQTDGGSVQGWSNGDTVIVPDNGDILINQSQGDEEVSADQQ
jgi:hypothetical protein